MPDIVEHSDWVLALIAGVSLFVAFRRRTLGGVLLMAPRDLEDPTRDRIGDRLVFRFLPATSLTSLQTFAPRVLLGMTIFTFLSILGYVVLPASAGWEAFVSKLVGWLVLLGLFGGLWSLIPLGVLAMVGAAASDWDPMWSGVSCGVMFGVFGGKTIFSNYRAVLEDTRITVRAGRSRTGAPLGLLGRLRSRVSLLFLYFIPFMLLHEVVSPFRPEIDLRLFADQLVRWQAWRYAIYVVAFMMGVNVVLYVVPFFREMLERTGIQTALGFNNIVLRAEEQERRLRAEGRWEEAQRDFEQEHMKTWDRREDVKKFLDEKGRWRHYGTFQIMFIAIVSCIFIASTVVNATDTFISLGFIERTPRTDNAVEFLSWFMICTNSVILLMLLGSGFRRLTRGRSWKSPWRETIEAAWSAIDDPNRMFTCHREGQEVRVKAAQISTCPSCGQTVPAEKSFCTWCGSPLT